jgi:hypothetical protein
MLSPQARETGMGFAQVAGSPYVYYWVEEIGARPTFSYAVFLLLVVGPPG